MVDRVVTTNDDFALPEVVMQNFDVSKVGKGVLPPTRLSLTENGSLLGRVGDVLTAIRFTIDAAANTIVRRDSAGRVKAAAPGADDDAVTLGYFKSNSPGTADTAATADTIVKRTAKGEVVGADPTGDTSLVTLAYFTKNKGGGSTSYAGLPAGVTITVTKTTDGTWPVRPTTRTDLRVIWQGADPSPAIGGTGMLENDIRAVTT